MYGPKACFLWTLGVAGVGLVVGLCVSTGLAVALKSPIPMSQGGWVVTWCLVVIHVMCPVASPVLVAMGVSGRFRGWVLGGLDAGMAKGSEIVVLLMKR